MCIVQKHIFAGHITNVIYEDPYWFDLNQRVFFMPIFV